MSLTESAISSNAGESATAAVVQEAASRVSAPMPRASFATGSAEQHSSRWRRTLGILVCLEVGIFLLVAPWSPLWTGNLLLGYFPALRPLFLSPFVRGAISGVGLLNLWFAFRGVWEFRDANVAAESE
jgi:hypothetical protein